ncbi:hypothetical protein DdX_17237 [Ditylenchus destructor]|uniref:Uncharacterized protein n=1 Tax=Ditylenchus destructor TaxID=166010 RepID=A0AAD4MPD6_9BILA|nr:hypothetical protein DdX_17237 [Ditylenchus destructor]
MFQNILCQTISKLFPDMFGALDLSPVTHFTPCHHTPYTFLCSTLHYVWKNRVVDWERSGGCHGGDTSKSRHGDDTCGAEICALFHTFKTNTSKLMREGP